MERDDACKEENAHHCPQRRPCGNLSTVPESPELRRWLSEQGVHLVDDRVKPKKRRRGEVCVLFYFIIVFVVLLRVLLLAVLMAL